jgi:hypothetical protein
MGADCTNAYSNAPLPTKLTYVRIDDTCVDWCRSRHGSEVDCSLVLPVLKALQGHPEDSALSVGKLNGLPISGRLESSRRYLF